MIEKNGSALSILLQIRTVMCIVTNVHLIKGILKCGISAAKPIAIMTGIQENGNLMNLMNWGLMMKNFSIGEYIIYVNGDKYEIGRIKSICEDGAFVAYHEGETGAKTSWEDMHKLINEYCIKETTLGGGYFGRME